jgi:hypothetical protein
MHHHELVAARGMTFEVLFADRIAHRLAREAVHTDERVDERLVVETVDDEPPYGRELPLTRNGLRLSRGLGRKTRGGR